MKSFKEIELLYDEVMYLVDFEYEQEERPTLLDPGCCASICLSQVRSVSGGICDDISDISDEVFDALDILALEYAKKY